MPYIVHLLLRCARDLAVSQLLWGGRSFWSISHCLVLSLTVALTRLIAWMIRAEVPGAITPGLTLPAASARPGTTGPERGGGFLQAAISVVGHGSLDYLRLLYCVRDVDRSYEMR